MRKDHFDKGRNATVGWTSNEGTHCLNCANGEDGEDPIKSNDVGPGSNGSYPSGFTCTGCGDVTGSVKGMPTDDEE